MAGTRIRIELELETVDESLEGRASASNGTVHEFSGWLGLLGVLQELVPDAVPDAEDHRTRQGDL